jgi:hypothetical protein
VADSDDGEPSQFAGLEAHFEREPGRSFPSEPGCPFSDDWALDTKDEFSFKIQSETSVVLEFVSIGYVGLGFQPVLTRRELFLAEGKASVERVPPRLFPGSIITNGRRGEQAKHCGDRKRQPGASNLDWMH